MLNEVNKEEIIKFFNNNGYVMDFGSNDFSYFTKRIIGFDILRKYPYSKGKALNKFVHYEPNRNVIKLTNALLEYYKNVYHRNEDYNNPEYRHLRQIISKNECNIDESDPLQAFLKSKSKTELDSYIKKEMNRLLHSLRIKDSDDIIHHSNCLVGAVLKYILYKQGSLNELRDKHKHLDNKTLRKAVLKSNLFSRNSLDKLAKILIHQLSGIINTINLMRDKHSDAHSKSPEDSSTPIEYAMLCVHATFTLVDFLIDKLIKMKKKYSTDTYNLSPYDLAIVMAKDGMEEEACKLNPYMVFSGHCPVSRSFQDTVNELINNPRNNKSN